MSRKKYSPSFLAGSAAASSNGALAILSRSLMLVLLLGTALPAAAALTIEPITWNTIGLDSNDVNVGPNQFPVGVRVCTDVAASNLSATFNWETSSSYINIRPGTLTTINIASLAADACTDFYFQVEVTRDPLAYGETRDYSITVTADGPLSVITPTRRLTVEHLISQNRNDVWDVQYGTDIGSLTSVSSGGSMTLMVGNTYFIRVVANTATQGYEQLESFLSLPNTIFQILAVETTYTADTSNTVSSPNDKLYADGCTWENDFNDPNYRSCLSVGKVGGELTVTYEVRILTTPTAPLANTMPLNSLIYDFSGSSFHYNASYDSSIRFANIITASISKAFSPKTILPNGDSTLTFTISNPGEDPLTYVNFKDSLPAGVTINDTGIAYDAGCTDSSTPSPALLTIGDTSLSIIDISIPAFGSCTITATVTAATDGSYINTTDNLFINGTAGVSESGLDTGSTGTDTLVMTSLPAPPSTCASPTTIATWSMDANAGTPPLFTTKAADVSAAVASYATVSGAQSIDTSTGNPVNSWGGTAPTGGAGWSETATSEANYFEFQIDTSNYGGVSISVDVQPHNNGDWANPNSSTFIKSSTDGTNFTVYEVSTDVYPQAAKGVWTSLTDIPADATGTTSTWFRISFDSGSKPEATILLDNIVFKGCPRPELPTLSKVFTPTTIGQGDSTTLTFSLSNPNSFQLTGVEFSDSLPAGLLIDNPTGTPTLSTTCSFGSGSITAADNTDTVTLNPATMNAGESCTITVDVSGELAGTFNNITGSISSTESGPNTTATGFGSDTLEVVAAPVINKAFTANPIFTGDSTLLTFTITNPNPPDITLSNVAFTDTLPAGLDVVAGSTIDLCGTGSTVTLSDSNPDTVVLSNGTLAAGDSCSFSVAVTGTTVGLKINTVEVTFDNGGGVSGTGNISTANVLVKDTTPAIALLKQVAPTVNGPWTNYLPVGEGADVYYRFTVENTGDTLLESVNVFDPPGGSAITCTWLDGNDDPLTAAFNLPTADADEGHLAFCTTSVAAIAGTTINIAEALGTYTAPNPDELVSDQSSATYATTDLQLDKTITAGSPFSAVGDIISYSYVVTNNGSSLLTGPVSIEDNKIASVSCPTDDLAAGASITCTASYTVTAEDLANNAVTNIATATMDSVISNSDIATAFAPPTAVTIGKVGLEVIEISDFLSSLSIDDMPTEALLTLFAAWEPDLAASLAGADRQSILDGLSDYLDPDGDGQVAMLRWYTLEQHGTIGFYVYRRQGDADWHQIHHDMLPGMLNAPMGAEYMLVDPGVAKPGTYLYRLVEQEAWGTTRIYGPYSLEIQR